MATVDLVYFAVLRETIGSSRETVDIPDEMASITDLIGWLRQRGPEYEAAFANPKQICAAIDRQHVNAHTAIGTAREIAFFPPVTGG